MVVGAKKRFQALMVVLVVMVVSGFEDYLS